jgi:hypothetical protein
VSCLGVHFALAVEDVDALRSAGDDRTRLSYVQDVIEERVFGGPRAAESDKAWDAMHRVFASGRLTPDGGTYPLNHVVLGGELLYSGDDYIMSLKTPAQVRDVADAIRDVSEADFRRRYDAIDPADYDGQISAEDFAYTWDWFQNVRDLYLLAATEGLFVLFTVDQ